LIDTRVLPASLEFPHYERASPILLSKKIRYRYGIIGFSKSTRNDVVTGLPLSEFVDALGESVVIARTPIRTDIHVTGLTFYDADAADTAHPGHLLLVTSPSAMGQRQVSDMFRFAAEQNHSAVVCKVPVDDASTLLLAAREAGVALVELAAGVSWRELDALASRLLGEHDGGLSVAPSARDRLFTLTNVIASTFRGSVLIEDHRRNILAYSAITDQLIDSLHTNSILYRKAQDTPVNESRYSEVFANPGVSRFEAYDTVAARAAIAIRSGNITLGSIWALDPDDPFLESPLPADKEDALKQCAAFAADYLVDAWRTENSTDRPREDSFSRLLMGPGLGNELTTLGLRPNESIVIAAVRAVEQNLTLAQHNDIRETVQRHAPLYFPGAISTTHGEHVLILLPAETVDSVVQVFLQILPELQRVSTHECCVGVGSRRNFRGDLSAQRDEAIDIVEASRLRRLGVGTLEDVRAQLLLNRCQQSLHNQEDLFDPELVTLLEGTTPRDNEARGTLLAWCEEQGNVAKIAVRLNVHEQTVRYRLRQLRSRIPLVSDDPDALLALWLQLRVFRPGALTEPTTSR
jgi:hypothetical protein